MASCGLCDGPPPPNPCLAPPKDTVAPGAIERAFAAAAANDELGGRLEHADPPVAVLDAFASDSEVAEIVALAEGFGFHPQGSGCGGNTRLCNMGYMQCDETPACASHPTVQSFTARMQSALGVPAENTESLGIFRYRPGETFRLHHDQQKPVPPHTAGGPRVWASAPRPASNLHSGGAAPGGFRRIHASDRLAQFTSFSTT